MDMYKDGYHNLYNIDISPTVIAKMKEQHEKQDIHCHWEEMDATALTFPSDHFDCVIDKGTLDAVLCGDDYSIPNKILKEMFRVVKPGKSVLLITHGNPANRKFLFEWNFYPETTSVSYKQQMLSAEVNLINILRSEGKDKTLADIVKDPELFGKCIKEWKADCEKKGEGKGNLQKLEFNHMEIEVARAKEHRVKELGLYQSNDPDQAEEISPEDLVAKAQTSTPTPELPKPTQELPQPIPTPELPTPQPAEASQKKTIVKVKDSGYNPPRQDHCFVYLIKKIDPNAPQHFSVAAKSPSTTSSITATAAATTTTSTLANQPAPQQPSEQPAEVSTNPPAKNIDSTN